MAINLTINGWNGTENGSWSDSADIINDQTEATPTKPKGIINLDTSIITGSGDTENRINTGGGDDWMRGQGFDIGIHNESFNKRAIIDTGAGNDVLYGISKTNLEKRISAGIWNNGHIYTGLGNDTIRGDADTNYGIYITSRNLIDTGEGNDRIIGITKGLTNNAVGIFTGGSITTGDGDDQVVGQGVTGIRNWQDQQISTGSGKDIIYGLGSSEVLVAAIGLSNDGTIDTGDDDDIIAGITRMRGMKGIDNTGDIRTGLGDDRIIGMTAGGGIGISNTYGVVIETEAGNDRIQGKAENGIGFDNYGTINTGDGNDTISGQGGSFGIRFVVGTARDLNKIDTGSGADVFYGIAVETGINVDGVVNTGDGDDVITGISTGEISDKCFGIYNYHRIITGLGNDQIKASANFGHGLSNSLGSTIDTGDGNDSIIANVKNGRSLFNDGTINTGSGDDLIAAGISLDSNGNVDIQGFFGNYGNIVLGAGNDRIKGFGTGTFNGGADTDTLELPSGTYTVGISGSDVTFTNAGRTMKTTDFEQLAVGSGIRSFTSLIAGQALTIF